MVVGLFVSLLVLEVLPEWTIFFVLLIIVREFLVTALRLVAASRGIVMAAERAGKLKTFTQIFSIGALIFSFAMSWDFVDYAWLPQGLIAFADVLGLVLFVLATFLTVLSGVHYMTKYWNLMMEDAG